MKQTIIMIICVIILIGGGIAEIKYLDKTSVFLSSDMDYIKNAIENDNYELANKQMEKSFKTWTDTKKVWNVFIIHEEVDDIEEALIELKEYLKFENKEECIVALEKVKKDLEHSVKRQEISIDNIL